MLFPVFLFLMHSPVVVCSFWDRGQKLGGEPLAASSITPNFCSMFQNERKPHKYWLCGLFFWNNYFCSMQLFCSKTLHFCSKKPTKAVFGLSGLQTTHGGVQRGFPPLPPAKYRYEIYHIYWYFKKLTTINRIVYNNNVPTKSGILKEK